MKKYYFYGDDVIFAVRDELWEKNLISSFVEDV